MATQHSQSTECLRETATDEIPNSGEGIFRGEGGQGVTAFQFLRYSIQGGERGAGYAIWCSSGRWKLSKSKGLEGENVSISQQVSSNAGTQRFVLIVFLVTVLTEKVVCFCLRGPLVFTDFPVAMWTVLKGFWELYVRLVKHQAFANMWCRNLNYPRIERAQHVSASS